MVMIAASGKEEETEGIIRKSKSMAMMGHERSKPPLHNFYMGCLKWGNQKFLRCVKVDSKRTVDMKSSPPVAKMMSSPFLHRQDDCEKRGSLDFMPSSPAMGIGGLKKASSSRVESDGDDGVEAVRAKMMLDFQMAVEKMKVSLTAEVESGTTATLPWNLRVRKAASSKAANGDGGGNKSMKIEEKGPGFSPPRTENKSPRLIDVSPEKKVRRKLTVGLSWREIEEDYFQILGQRPPRRPKKRAKIVQKNLDALFPGLWLTEITTDTYKVPDWPESGKR